MVDGASGESGNNVWCPAEELIKNEPVFATRLVQNLGDLDVLQMGLPQQQLGDVMKVLVQVCQSLLLF